MRSREVQYPRLAARTLTAHLHALAPGALVTGFSQGGRAGVG